MPDITFVFSIVAAVIVAGFLGELFFRKTGVPSFVFLIFMGILIGPVFQLFSRTALLPSLGYFAAITLLLVLFYGGMDMRVGAVLRGGGRVLLQVVIYVLGSTVAIAFVVSVLLRWDLLSSFIFASMVGGETTAAVVIPLSRSMRLHEATVVFLTLESVMNSILSIVLFFAFVGIYQTGIANWASALQTVAANFSVGIVLGAALSVVWILILNRFQQTMYIYVLSVWFVFLTYVFSNRLGGSGELSVLIFGIMLGNYGLLNKKTSYHVSMDVLQKRLGLFEEEISFLMETLFFVFLGLTFAVAGSTISRNLAIGVEILLLLVLFRVISTSVSTLGSELRENMREIVLMCAQGLVPATLAIISVGLALPHSEDYLNIVTYVVILTNVVTAIGAIAKLRSQKLGLKDFMASLDYQYRQEGEGAAQ